jgi:hypothetical protein
MRIRLAIPDHLVTPEALEAALEATSLANEQAIKRGEVPPLTEAIASGVRWKPEPYTDGEHFDLSHVVAARKWGDCDDLAPWLAGELRATGEDPGARPRVYQSGPNRWHVVTETSDGQILDPSRWAGMGKKSSPSVSGVAGITARPFARRGEGAMCVVPHDGKWWSRCDLPFPGAEGHLASHARASTPEESLDRAIAGAIACGEEIDCDLIDRARVMGAMLIGDIDEDPEIGSIFSKLAKLVKKAVPFATSFIPGVGPIAREVTSAAMHMADKALRHHPSHPQYHPPARHTVVRALTHGGGRARPSSDTIRHEPTGAVSVPIHQADPLAAMPTGAPGPAMLYFHPANAIGPVVLRF